MEKVNYADLKNQLEDYRQLLQGYYLELNKNIVKLQEFNDELDEILLEMNNEKESVDK